LHFQSYKAFAKWVHLITDDKIVYSTVETRFTRTNSLFVRRRDGCVSLICPTFDRIHLPARAAVRYVYTFHGPELTLFATKNTVLVTAAGLAMQVTRQPSILPALDMTSHEW
jgi:hypothetical protein